MNVRRGTGGPPRTANAARAAFVAAIAVAVAGCATVRNAREVQDPASAVPGERTPTAAEMGLPSVGPVTVDQVVRAALSAHPSVVQARRSAEAAQARCRQAEAAALPQVSATGSLTYRDQQDEPRGTEHRFSSYGFDVSWLVFDFGRTRAFERQAGEQWLAAQADLRATEADVAFGVRAAYFGLTKQIQLLAVARETVRQFTVRLDQVREQMNVGKRLAYDVTTAEVALAQARLAEVKAADAALLAQATLANAAGLAEIVDWSPVADPLPTAPTDFAAAWDAAHTSRPTLAAAAARERAASALIDARVADLYPSLDLGLGVTASGSPTPIAWSWQAGPSVRWVPFDGFANVATIDESVANLRAARASRAAAEQQAWLDLRSAWLGFEDAQRRLDLTEIAVRSAEENVALAQARFDVRAATSVELTDAQQSLALARAEDVQARADRSIAAANLRRALGEPTSAASPESEARMPGLPDTRDTR